MQGRLFWSAAAIAMTLFAVSPAVAQIPPAERDALIALYNSTNGDSWTNHINWLGPSGTECTWSGVRCDTAGTTVKELFLDLRNLDGQLPPEIGSLSNLTFLTMRGNKLTGPLPDTIAGLPLTNLHLDFNYLTGDIDVLCGCPSLQYVNVMVNQLSGPIPDCLGQLTGLRELLLDEPSQPRRNQFDEGPIPEWLRYLPDLTVLRIANRNGTIPPWIGELSQLQVFTVVRSPNLTGPIPTEIGQLSSLWALHIRFTGVSGPLPSTIGDLTELGFLYLDSNQIEGPIPSSVGNLTKLTTLCMQGNLLEGPIPPEIGNLTELVELNLGGNLLEGPIPAQIGNLTKLTTRLSIVYNPNLTGPIPPEIGNLVRLQILDLRNCQLDGPIPPELGNMSSLWDLNLSRNNLTGPIPRELGGLANLRALDVQGNHLSGSIPPELGNLTRLASLWLGENRLSGTIPEEIGNLPLLNILHLWYNALVGPIPPALIQLGNSLLLRIEFNGLFTDDVDLQNFLESTDPNWDIQTLPPMNLAVRSVGADVAELQWTPIFYRWFGGGRYRVLKSLNPGGPYELLAVTSGLYESSLTVTGLDHGTTYYFVIQSVSNMTPNQQNQIESVLSTEVTATTISLNQPPLVEAGPDQAANEGQPVSLTSTSFTDPDAGDTHSAVIDWGDGHVEDGAVSGYMISGVHFYDDDGTYEVSVTVTDSYGESGSDIFAVTVFNVAPVVGSISAAMDPVQVGTEISTGAPFADAGLLDTHAATWSWGDGQSDPGMVTEADGSGSVSGSHAYQLPGVYTVELTVTDDDGATGSAAFRYVVVYDPEGGFVTGGGWIESPLGAYAPDPTLTGKANFGFVSKYKKGATEPTGQTQFQFKVADLDFHSTAYQWLVVAGAKAMYKGDGTINGEGLYGFMLSAVDGALPGGGGVDKFRIKIWDKATEAVVYDNMMDTPEDAEPVTGIGGGSIVIHQ